MKHRRKSNKRLTSDRERNKQFFIDNVVKRGSNAMWTAIRACTWRLVKMTLFIALVGGTCYGATHGWRKLFWHNPDYALKEFRFSTDGSLTREQALQITGFFPGRNVFSYKLAAAHDALQAMPQVESVEVNRYLPNQIEVKVVERKPMAWVMSKAPKDAGKSARRYLLDSKGVVFLPKKTLPEFEPLPVISGVEIEDLEPGKPIRKAEIVSALELLRSNGETGAFRALNINVSKGYCLVVTDQRQSLLTFGLDDISQQLEKLGSIQKRVAEMGQEIERANLMPKVNVPVILRPPPRVEPEDVNVPEPARTTRSKDAGSTSAPAKEKAGTPARKTTPSKSDASPRKNRHKVTKPFLPA